MVIRLGQRARGFPGEFLRKFGALALLIPSYLNIVKTRPWRKWVRILRRSKQWFTVFVLDGVRLSAIGDDNTSRFRVKRSFSWSEGQRGEDDVLRRSQELLEKLNRRSSDLTETVDVDHVRSSLEEVHRNARRLVRRRSYLRAVEGAGSDSPEEARRNKCRLVRRRSYLRAVEEASIEFDAGQNASVDEEDRSTPQLLASHSSETDSTSLQLKELHEVKCEQETWPSCGSELVVGSVQKFAFLSQQEEMFFFPSSKTYTDLSTTLTDEDHVRV